MNALYEAFQTQPTDTSTFSMETLDQWWNALKSTGPTRFDTLTACLLYGGHMGLLSQSDNEDLHALAQKAKAKLDEKLATPAVVRSLYVQLRRYPTAAEEEE